MKYDIFISYSRKDIEKVRPIINDLEAREFNIWLDLSKIDYGDTFPDKIAEALDASDSILFMCTPNSLTAPYCKKEIGYARTNKKKIRAILVDGIMPTKGWFALGYQDVNCIDFTKSEQWGKFIEDIESVYQPEKAEERKRKIELAIEEAKRKVQAEEQQKIEAAARKAAIEEKKRIEEEERIRREAEEKKRKEAEEEKALKEAAAKARMQAWIEGERKKKEAEEKKRREAEAARKEREEQRRREALAARKKEEEQRARRQASLNKTSTQPQKNEYSRKLKNGIQEFLSNSFFEKIFKYLGWTAMILTGIFSLWGLFFLYFFVFGELGSEDDLVIGLSFIICSIASILFIKTEKIVFKYLTLFLYAGVIIYNILNFQSWYEVQDDWEYIGMAFVFDMILMFISNLAIIIGSKD